MTRRVRYTADEVRRIIMSMPDDDDSDDPDFSGEDGDVNAGTDVDSSDSDSDSDFEPLPIQNLGAGAVRGRGRGRGRARNLQGRNLGRERVDLNVHGQGDVPHPPQQHRQDTAGQRWGDLDNQTRVDYPEFHGRHGPSTPLGIDSTPVDFWQQLFPDELVQHIADETNRITAQKRRKVWDGDTSCDEMKAFIGVLYLMGIHRLPQFNDYFSKDFVLGVPAVQAVFTQRRFYQLWSNIHLVNNEDAVPAGQPGHDKLFKLRQFLQTLRNTFRDHFYIGQNVSVDEHMVKGKGRNPFKQYMPAKPVKRGTKIWCIGCSDCAYLYDFQLYTGAAAGGEKGLSYRVVMDLVTPNLGEPNHVVYLDNFFTGLELADDLQERSTYTVGTIRIHRKGFPEALKDPNLTKNLPRGQLHTCSDAAKGLTCTVWQDTKLVAFLSNAHDAHGHGTVSRKRKSGEIVQIEVPPCVRDYNKNMGAIDRHDQMQSTYAIDRKSKRWWMRIFLGMLDIVMVNSNILYTHSFALTNNPMPDPPAKQLTTKGFRCEVIHELIGNFSCRRHPGPALNFDPALPVTNRGHQTVDLQSLGILKKGRCHECCLGKGGVPRKETKYGCATCQKRLCPVSCHANYHNRVFRLNDN